MSKSFLQIAFFAIFVVSFVLVVVEKNRINEQEQARSDASARNTLTSSVQGASSDRGQDITMYSEHVKDALLALNSNIDLLLQGKAYSLGEVKSVYTSLVNIKVPVPYQSLHLQIVRITQETIRGQEADLNYLRQQRRLLFKEYPWLALVIKQ